MGKAITLYLTDEELRLIDQICETQGCNTHSVVKAGVKLLLGEATRHKLFPQGKTEVPQPRPKKKPSEPLEAFVNSLLEGGRC